MRGLLRSLFLWLVVIPVAWSAPDQTMSVVPSATSGTTINAADENTRNSNISTPYNAHTHTDISSTSANTFNVGDGAAGNKNICANAADSTDACLRFDDTANLWLVDNPAGTFNQIVTITGTAGLTTGTIVMADGTGSIRSLTSVAGADDQTLVWDSATAATPRTLPNCLDTSGQHLNYTQATNSFSCGTTTGTDVGGTNASRVQRTAGDVTTTSTTLVDLTGASITITTGANPVLASFAGSCSNDVLNNNISINMDIDSGTLAFGTAGFQINENVAVNEQNCGFTALTAALTAASHTFKIQWSTTNNTATMVCGTATPCTFSIVEVVD